MEYPDENVVTSERIAFLTFCKQLAEPETIGNGEHWRSATFATDDGLMTGEFAGLSEDGRFLRVAQLQTPIGEYEQCSLRDTDVLFARFQLSDQEIAKIRASRIRLGPGLEEHSSRCAIEEDCQILKSNKPAVKPRMNTEEEVVEEDDDDDDLGAIGFMFDSEVSRSQRTFRFPLTSDGTQAIEMNMMCIDDDPGAVQSGHYIWPAASALAFHLVSVFNTSTPSSSSSSSSKTCQFLSEKRVIELGAGCGLSGIMMAHLGAKRVCFTDHDPKTLDLISENLDLQTFSCINNDEAISDHQHNEKNCFTVCQLEWGEKYYKHWPEDVKSVLENGHYFDYVLCSDVIYDHGVIEPLLWTIKTLLGHPNQRLQDNQSISSDTPHLIVKDSPAVSKAFLCASFTLEIGTNETILRICERLGLKCELIYDNLASNGCRLQEITLINMTTESH